MVRDIPEPREWSQLLASVDACIDEGCGPVQLSFSVLTQNVLFWPPELQISAKTSGRALYPYAC